ncbi:MAG: hypothetical protein J6N54_01665 [Bacteroidales bacterium]|nr:hypothetical protein [Bacteroidales bacterium]
MTRVAILITVREGDDGTSGCVEECQKQIDAVASEGKYSFSIFLNDAGENGCLAVWEKASEEGADLFLWIDHDLRLEEGMLSCLLENSEFLRHKAVVAGTVSRADKSLLFGGRTRRGRLLEPDPVIPIPCNLFDLSIALVPEYAFAHLENPEDFFRRGFLYHGLGRTLSRAGVARMIAPGVLATTDRQAEIPAWKKPDSTLWEKTVWVVRSIFK